jgi:cytochrome b subunit of formate dehydrogenase
MNAYPRYFLWLLGIVSTLLVISGLALTPGMFELRLEWEVPWTLPSGWRSVAAGLHGFCTMAVLLMVGALLPLHVRAGLRLARNFVSGILLLTALAILALTGWTIYYVINEELSKVGSIVHLLTGIAVLVPATIHVVRGLKLRRERELQRQSEQIVSNIRRRVA